MKPARRAVFISGKYPDPNSVPLVVCIPVIVLI